MIVAPSAAVSTPSWAAARRARGEIVLRSTFPAGGEDSIAGEAIVLPRNRWSCGNGRIEGFGLVRREVHVRRGGGFLCRESAIEAEASAKGRRVEEGQGELSWFMGRRS